MAKHTKTHAKTDAAPSPQKRGKTTRARPSIAPERPLFCFRHVDRASKHKWVFRPSDEHAQLILTFLCEMAALTWIEIEQQMAGGHKKHHNQPLESVENDAQKDAAKRKLGETFGETMFRFRLGNKPRLWGFRQGRVFHVVWWDWDHKVYPTDPN